VFNDSPCDWTFSSDLVAALSLCRDAGARIVNMSLSGAELDPSEDSGQQAHYCYEYSPDPVEAPPGPLHRARQLDVRPKR
jgi:hypothetical protein